MKRKTAKLPTTGEVLDFLVKCFGQSKSKGVNASFKQIERLAKQTQQRDETARKIEAALIDAVATVFDVSMRDERITEKMRSMSLQQRIMSSLAQLAGHGTVEKRLTPALVFWIVYFIEHHQWLCPQLETQHEGESLLREWVQHVWHLYTNTLADTANAYRSIFQDLPQDVSWNVPQQLAGDKIKWPVCLGLEWLRSIVSEDEARRLPDILFPGLQEPGAHTAFSRVMRGGHLLGLDKIECIAAHNWQFNERHPTLTGEKLKVVFLWCRALEYGLRKVEKRFGSEFLWELVTWHKVAVGSQQRYFENSKKGGEQHGRTNAS